MGMCLNGSASKEQASLQNNPTASKIEEVDIVKVKLKNARDKIQNFINAKNRDIAAVDANIKQKLPEYQQTGNKKKLLPLLKVKKDLLSFIENAEIRQRLINDKLAEVEMQKVNVDTINVLEDSNKYLKVLQNDLEKRDWKQVLEEAKNKYEIQWPEEQSLENDPKFQAIWQQLGGNKIPSKKQVHVSIPNNQQTIVNKPQTQTQTRMVLA